MENVLIESQRNQQNVVGNRINWSVIFIGLMLLLNNLIIIYVVYNLEMEFDNLSDSIKNYFNNYTLHVAFK